MLGRAPFVLGATVLGTGAIVAYHPADQALVSAASISQTGTSQAGTSQDGAGASATPDIKVTGPAVETDYGPVQVSVSLSPATGLINSVTALKYPVELPKSKQINLKAIPRLEQESRGLLDDKRVRSISGATYTSDGFRKSLAGALAKARAANAQGTITSGASR